MDWHPFAAVILGAVLGSLADWLFAGVLFHGRYQTYPEVWRAGAGSEGGRIAMAQGLALVTAAGFVALAMKLAATDLLPALKLAAMIWLIAPLPLLLANGLFIKLDWRVTLSHAAGWLAKLLLIAAATVLLLG